MYFFFIKKNKIINNKKNNVDRRLITPKSKIRNKNDKENNKTNIILTFICLQTNISSMIITNMLFIYNAWKLIFIYIFIK